MIRFGTDGIRGIFGAPPLLISELIRIGHNLGLFLQSLGNMSPHVVLGWDPRASSPFVAQALVTGLHQVGVQVVGLGVVPTPAVSFLTTKLKASMGLMVSASHNPAAYNGIKFFNDRGRKLSLKQEANLLAFLNMSSPISINSALKPFQVESWPVALYEAHLKSCVTKKVQGLRVVLDCAHGSLYEIAPRVLRDLGVEIVAQVGVTPTGENINDGCGSLYPELARLLLLQHKADLALTFDGDGDRVLAVDQDGFLANGDQILACFEAHHTGAGGIVGTVLSNLGLETFLAEHGKAFVRTAVGDRWISQALVERDWQLGGEACGHIIVRPHMETGDGLLVGVLLAMIKADSKQSPLFPLFVSVPSFETTLPLRVQDILERPHVQEHIQECTLRWQGRLVVRKSGTEPIVRLLAEGACLQEVHDLVDRLRSFLDHAQTEIRQNQWTENETMSKAER